MSDSPVRKRARKHIALRERLAAALSMLLPQTQRDELRARKVTAKAVISLFEFHHVVFHGIGGSNKWENLTPMLAASHKARTPADASTIAKVRRLARVNEDFQRRVLAINKKPRDERSRWPQGRKMQSRGFRRRP